MNFLKKKLSSTPRGPRGSKSKKDDDAGEAAPATPAPVENKSSDKPVAQPVSGSGRALADELASLDMFSEEVPGYTVGGIVSPNLPSLRKATEIATGKSVALKLVPKANLEGRQAEVNEQLALLQSLEHDNIAQMLTSLESEKYLIVVFDMPDGPTLFDHVASLDQWTENDLRVVVTGILSAVEYLHSKRIVHRNLSTDTIRMDADGVVKLIDFGVGGGDGVSLISNSAPLVWDSMPPEMVTNPDVEQNPSTDMWALGNITYVLLMGFPPFWGTDKQHLYQSISECTWKFSSPYADAISRASRSFVSSLLKASPDDRQTSAEAVKDAWITGAYVNDIDESVVPDKHLNHNHLSLKTWNQTRNEQQQGVSAALSLQSGEKEYMHPEHAALIVQAYVRGSYTRSQMNVKKKIDIKPPQTDVLANIKDSYDVGQQLGKGAFGTVVLATNKKTKQKVAIKMIKKREVVEKKMQKQVQEEINLQASLDHPGLVKIIQVVDTKRHVCLVQELLTGGELFDKIVELKCFTEATAIGLVTQMFEAIKYLHDNKIAHRDLKPENIIFFDKSEDSPMKITDFGYAHFSDKGSYKNVVGTLDYMAPEVFKREKYDEKCDVWSAGVIVFCMVCGCPPFRGGSDEDIRYKILNGDLKWPKRSAGLSDAARAFIYRTLEMNPNDRYSAAEALNDPWLHTEGSNAHLEDTMMAMKKWNAVRKLRRGLIASLAVSRMEGKIEAKMNLVKAVNEASQKNLA